jgi:hypothetical protein
MSTNSNLLVNAPLKEVIFVLNWELDFILQQNAFIDTGFDEALLSFTSNCQPEFNTFEILVPSGFPPSLLTHYTNLVLEYLQQMIITKITLGLNLKSWCYWVLKNCEIVTRKH